MGATGDTYKFTDKQQRFIEEYTKDFNATQAAIRAGYSENSAHDIGSENLRKPDIAKAIEDRINRLTMSADEALIELGKIARGTPSHFVEVDDNEILRTKFASDEARENMHLIKKIKQSRHVTRIEDIETEDIRTEFELYDKQRALVDILKMHGKFIERVEQTTYHYDLTGLTDAEIQELEESEDPRSFLDARNSDRKGEEKA